MIGNNYHQPSIQSAELLTSNPVIASCLVKSGHLSAKDAIALSQCCKAFHRSIYEVDVRKLMKASVGFINLVGSVTKVDVNGNTTVKKAVEAFSEKGEVKDGTKVFIKLPSIREGFCDPLDESIASLKILDVAPKAHSMYRPDRGVYSLFSQSAF